MSAHPVSSRLASAGHVCPALKDRATIPSKQSGAGNPVPLFTSNLMVCHRFVRYLSGCIPTNIAFRKVSTMSYVSRVLCVFLSLTFGVVVTAAQDEDPCGFARAIALVAYDYEEETLIAARPATDADRSTLMQFDGIYNWVGYEAGGFDRPLLENSPVMLQILLDDGKARYVYLYDDLDATTDTQWVWAFRSLTVSTDANGEYLGMHDICASGGWAYDAVAELLHGEEQP